MRLADIEAPSEVMVGPMTCSPERAGSAVVCPALGCRLAPPVGIRRSLSRAGFGSAAARPAAPVWCPDPSRQDGTADRTGSPEGASSAARARELVVIRESVVS